MDDSSNTTKLNMSEVFSRVAEQISTSLGVPKEFVSHTESSGYDTKKFDEMFEVINVTQHSNEYNTTLVTHTTGEGKLRTINLKNKWTNESYTGVEVANIVSAELRAFVRSFPVSTNCRHVIEIQRLQNKIARLKARNKKLDTQYTELRQSIEGKEYYEEIYRRVRVYNNKIYKTLSEVGNEMVNDELKDK